MMNILGVLHYAKIFIVAYDYVRYMQKDHRSEISNDNAKNCDRYVQLLFAFR